jgi:hypothetical protein
MKFRKKPVVVEAMRLPPIDEDASEELIAFLDSAPKDTIYSDYDGGVSIATLEGTMRGDPGDWIIKGVNGEFYPCKNDVFMKSYEIVEPIPSNVYWSPESANFYSGVTKSGLGSEFYMVWKHRVSEFPVIEFK